MTNGEKLQSIFPNLEYEILSRTVLTNTDNGAWYSLDWWNAEYKEPITPDDCETCIHNKGLLECDMYGCKYESTTKNDLAVDCISRADLYNRIKKIDHDEDYECDEFGGSKITYHTCDWDEVLREIEDAPSVTPQEPIKKLEEQIKQLQNRCHALTHGQICVFCPYECEHKAETENT